MDVTGNSSLTEEQMRSLHDVLYLFDWQKPEQLRSAVASGVDVLQLPSLLRARQVLNIAKDANPNVCGRGIRPLEVIPRAETTGVGETVGCGQV
jgi:hypothetical protein